MELGQVSARGADKIVRVAWSLADLAGQDQPGSRRGQPRDRTLARGGAVTGGPDRRELRASGADLPGRAGRPPAQRADAGARGGADPGRDQSVGAASCGAELSGCSGRHGHGALAGAAGRTAATRTADRLPPSPGSGSSAQAIRNGRRSWPTWATTQPYALWLRGTADLRFNCLRSVAIVGSRAATAYGSYVAAEFAASVAARGWAVISGGAFGVDAAAHRGALGADGVTVAVLACGVDVPYPAGHADLLDAIAAQGVIVSEWPPGRTVSRLRFLVRNRVIAALATGTLVVEAGAAQRRGQHRAARQRPRPAADGGARPGHLRPVRRLPPHHQGLAGHARHQRGRGHRAPVPGRRDRPREQPAWRGWPGRARPGSATVLDAMPRAAARARRIAQGRS